MRFYIAALLLISCQVLLSSAHAAESSVPTKLFGIELGGQYRINEDGVLVGAPIGKFTGMNRFLGEGIHYFFKPNEEYPGFEYVEFPEEDSQYFKTSFRLYLFPVLADTSNVLETQVEEIEWEVSDIEWSILAKDDDKDAKESAYYWAKNLCESVKVDLNIPESASYDYWEDKTRHCEFSDDGRSLEISSYIGRSFSLKYSKDVWDAKDAELEKQRRKAEMEQSRPYE